MHFNRIIPLIFLIIAFACTKKGPSPETLDSPARTAAEELETFQIEPGFKVQLVASEPLIEDPVLIQFDENGRLWVVEMRGYMTDLDGSEEDQPIGRISILEDENGDGEMDKSTIYLDNLVMPRALGLIKGGALIAENNSLWITQDTDGDLKADTKVLLDSTYASSGVPEHSDNGFVRNVDNWYYSAKSRLRYRTDGENWIRDSTELRGQWGISQDDQGRLIYNYNWSQLHGDLVPANYLSRNPNHTPTTGIDHGLTIDRKIFPIRSNPAINRGYIPGTLSEAGKLLEFTSACSPTVNRSHLFPAEYFGNIFVMENAGNIIKRNVVKQNGILLEATDPNSGREFMASTDERFRPVHGVMGPDGALYIADMYRGIVQHGSYMTPYLKEQTLGRGLNLPVHLGRIWRIVPEDWKPAPFPKLTEESNTELISRLSHPEGWHRDMAQRLLVERNDATSIEGLVALAKRGASEMGRFHALWTLEGMNALNSDLLFETLEDQNSLIKNTSLRLLAPFAQTSQETLNKLETKMVELSKTSEVTEGLQVALSSASLGEAGSAQVLENIIYSFGEQTLIQDAVMSSLSDREYGFLAQLWDAPNWENADQNKEIFLETLTAAIMKRGDNREIKSLLTLVDSGSPELNWKQETILIGMAIQAANPQNQTPVLLAGEPDLFKRTDLPIDQNRLNGLKRRFSWPGHVPEARLVSASSLDEKAQIQFAEGRKKYLVSCAGCHGSNGKGVQRMAPPLAASDWILGDERRLALIILHGIEGPIEVNGKKYDAPEILPVMASHSTMDDASIAAILTYVRNEWGNSATSVARGLVSGTRHTSQGRVYPWSPAELNKHIESLAVLKTE
jgi:mono/diheme cytochrome c family protein/glucose/arabinose dehydrogenase